MSPHRPTRKKKRGERVRRLMGRLRKRTPGTAARTGKWRGWWRYLWRGFAVLALLFLGYVIYLDIVVREQFESKRWALPAHVYARPLELFVGLPISTERFTQELASLNYRYAYQAKDPASYQREGDRFDLTTRAFRFWDANEPSRALHVEINGGAVTVLRDRQTGRDIDLARLDPAFIGGIYPAHHEDRILLKYDDVPPLLPQTLIAIEDRKFETHHGIDLRGILRALKENIAAGSAVQGGSTITQQLVKNFYLSNERTLRRKFNEIIMAVLLDLHYDKNEIMEAYINEIYLGQDGQRAIHGFGLASRFYFEKPLNELDTAQIATLVAMIRGPGFYHPEKHSKRLRQRRDLILDTLAERGIISAQQAMTAKQQELRVIPERGSGITDHPAFLDLVRRQLREFYHDEDLTSEGLRIFTTLDPVLQKQVEAFVLKRVAQMDKQRKLQGALQGAVVVTSINPSGEIVALVGDRNPRFAGFNRAVDAARPIGSLMKPAVFLTALSQPKQYNWLTRIDDAPLTLKNPQGQTWSPRNYDNQSHGMVPMVTALSHSYNQATVRLGMELGFAPIQDSLHRLGIKRSVPAYPATLLGAVEMTPLDIMRMYHTFAAGGFESPIRAIRDVMNAQGEPLRRYPIQIEQRFNPALINVLNTGLVQVVERGTAQSVRAQLPVGMIVAGKTGTTNDMRDSWFAGFSASHTAVVWLGTDDNQATGLTGSSGALKIWGDIMAVLPPAGLSYDSSDDFELQWVEPATGLLSAENCEGSMYLGFMKGTLPTESSACAGNIIDRAGNWFRNLFR